MCIRDSYHTTRHLEECFAELAAVRADATRPAEVELALWCHDAIYDTARHDNEQRARANLERSVARLKPKFGFAWPWL